MSVNVTGAPTNGPDAVHGFYFHLTIYLIVNGFLLALNLLAGGPIGAVWPLLGWGIGLIAHGLTVFLRTPQGPRNGMAGS